MSYGRSVFVSATTAGLGGWRKSICDILVAQNIKPLEQTWLGPEGTNVRRKIESAISNSTGVICLVGPYYGYPLEPVRDSAPVPRSYTQYEWDIATKHGKPRLVYLIKDEFFPAEPAPGEDRRIEDPRLRESQEAFREDVRAKKQYPQRGIVSPQDLGVQLAMINWREWPYGGS